MFGWLKKEYEIYKLINHKVEISNGFRNIPKIELSPYEILVGESYGKPLIVNMKSTPHLLITGLSGLLFTSPSGAKLKLKPKCLNSFPIL